MVKDDYSKYIKKLKKKIRLKTKYNDNLSNDDLHDLFYLYDRLDYYMYYENENEHKRMLDEFRSMLDSMRELYGDIYDF